MRQLLLDGVETLDRTAVVVLPVADDELLGQAGELGAAGTGGSRRTHLDPLLKGRDLRVGKLGALLARRHRKIGIRLMDGKDQHGFLDIARHDRRT